MRPTRPLALLLLAALPCAAEWTLQQKQWALASAGILAELNHSPYDRLDSNIGQSRESVKWILERQWGVLSREDLLTLLPVLLLPEKRRSDIAWDYARAINVARYGFTVGYIDETEAWDFIQPAAERLQLAYSSWQE